MTAGAVVVWALVGVIFGSCTLEVVRIWRDRPGVVRGADGRWRAARTYWRRR